MAARSFPACYRIERITRDPRVRHLRPRSRAGLHPRHRHRRSRGRPGAARSSPAFRRSRTATSTSATPSRSASISAWRRSSAATATSASTTPTRPGRSRNIIDAIERDVHWLGFDWGGKAVHASDYFEQLYDWAVDLIRAGKAYVDDQSQDGDAGEPRHADRAGHRQPVAGPERRGEPRPLRPDARRRIPEWRAGAPGEDRHGLGQHQPPRSGALPHPPRRASADRHGLVHLSELRLRPWPVGCDRRRHAFALHARIRRPPAALRLADRQPAGPVAAAAVRVRPAQPHLHAALQARAHRAGARRPCRPAGTIRACRPSPGCAGAACRRRRSATSSAGSASRGPTAWSTSRCSRRRSARC